MYELESERDIFLPEELASKLACLTEAINREIAVYINRKGSIIDISIGDSSKVSLPEFEGRRSQARLSGVRCVHTHPNGDGKLSLVDINSLISLKLDAMMALGVEKGQVTEIFAAVPAADEAGNYNKADVYGPFTLGDRRLDALFDTIIDLEKNSNEPLHINEAGSERAILVGVEAGVGKLINGKSEGERLLDELEELAATAGAQVVHKVLQRRSSTDPAYHIGKGKVEELGLIRQALNASLIIFDDELSGAQVRNIEEVVGVRVIDRTVLILDIFAQRARSREGKLQVELAQLKYRLPRLIGMGNQLSRLGGGIGTRGPGEKKLEVDRRHIRRRVSALEKELEGIGKRRGLFREGRRKNDVPTIALVGYTNVGKSTLMNKLCGSEVYVENQLFATLDPTARKMELPDGRNVLLIDTVGFIRKLPHDLIEAFKSTLEEAVHADLLLHVVDASSEEVEMQIQVADEILESLGASGKPSVLVFNKIDLLRDDYRLPSVSHYAKNVEVSAVTGKGLEQLTEDIRELLPANEVIIELTAPYSEGWILPYLYNNGKVLNTDYIDQGVKVEAQLDILKIERIRKFLEKPKTI
ncbi:MAG: GTPase HflX [Clostridia bacterium]|nr:GTPase HflX [Clostridia bacterium]